MLIPSHNDVNLGYLVKMVSAGIFHYKHTYSFIIINTKYVEGETAIMQIFLFLLELLCTDFSGDWWFLSVEIITVAF